MHPTTSGLKTVDLFDLAFISEASLEEVADAMFEYVDSGPHREALPLVITPNVDYLVKFSHPRYRAMGESLKNSAFVLPDGQPVVWASRWVKKPLANRLTGADLFPILWRTACAEQRKVLAIVASAEIGEKLSQENPNFRYHVPEFYQEDQADKVAHVHEECRRLFMEFQPDLMILGIAAPKQQAIALHLCECLEKEENECRGLILMLGASMEFYVGTRKRAPRFMQKFGIEWMHRLLLEPRRMIKRYNRENMRFVQMVLSEKKKVANSR